MLINTFKWRKYSQSNQYLNLFFSSILSNVSVRDTAFVWVLSKLFLLHGDILRSGKSYSYPPQTSGLRHGVSLMKQLDIQNYPRFPCEI